MAKYYAANNGNDANAGTSELIPKLLFASALALCTVSADQALGRKGDTFPELLTIPIHGVVIDSYGTGTLPFVDAADPVSGFAFDSTQAGGDRWKKVTLGAYTPTYTWSSVGDDHTLLIKDASLAANTVAGHWWYESGTDTLYVVVPVGEVAPDVGKVVRAGRRNNAIKASNGKNDVILQNLNLRFTNTTLTTEALIQATSTTAAYDNWLIDNVKVQWGSGGINIISNSGTPWAAVYTIVVRNFEDKYDRGHGLQLTYYTNAVVQNINIHDCGRQGAGMLLRNSVIDSCRFDRCGNASDLWGAQRPTVQGFDHGLYLVGQPTGPVAAFGNMVKYCIATGNAKGGLATDASSYSNTFYRCISYSNILFGLFLEGGTENGSEGNRVLNCTFWNNGKSALHVNNAHGWFEARNNLFFLNGRDGSQDLWVQQDYSGTWTLHSGTPGTDAVYKRIQAPWEPATVGFALGTVATQRASIALVQTNANSWFYDAAADILYGRNTGSTAITQAWTTTLTPNILNYNDYTPAASLAAGGKIARFNKPSGATTYTDLPTMAAAESVEANGLQVDPQFTDPAHENFDLLPTSTVLGKGAVLGGRNVAPDLGAREFGGSPFVSGDRTKETTTSTGLGDMLLNGPSTGFQAFSAVCADNDMVAYTISGGGQWEVGYGIWTFDNRLTRIKVESSSNNCALVSFSAGTKDVWADHPAEQGILPVTGRVLATDHLIPTNSSVYVSDEYEVTPGHEIEIGLNAVLEIG